MQIESNTRIIDLTWGELRQAIMSLIEERPARTQGDNMVKGIAGIMELFQCSQRTANRLKNGILAPAVQQCAKGHTIMLDKDLAIKLYNQQNNQ